MGAVLHVWTIVTKANARFRLRLLCLFPCWVGTEQIFPRGEAVGHASLAVSMIVKECQVMMAALILWTEAQSIVRNGECNLLTYFPSFKRVRRLEKSAYVSPFTCYYSWTPPRCGARWHAPLKSTATKVQMIFKHHSTNK